MAPASNLRFKLEDFGKRRKIKKIKGGLKDSQKKRGMGQKCKDRIHFFGGGGFYQL